MVLIIDCNKNTNEGRQCQSLDGRRDTFRFPDVETAIDSSPAIRALADRAAEFSYSYIKMRFIYIGKRWITYENI